MRPITEAEGLSLVPRWCGIALAPIAFGYLVAVLPVFMRGADVVMLAVFIVLALPVLMPFYLAALSHHICRVSAIAGWKTRFHFLLVLGAMAAIAWLPLFLLLIVFATVIGPSDAAMLERLTTATYVA